MKKCQDIRAFRDRRGFGVKKRNPSRRAQPNCVQIHARRHHFAKMSDLSVFAFRVPKALTGPPKASQDKGRVPLCFTNTSASSSLGLWLVECDGQTHAHCVKSCLVPKHTYPLRLDALNHVQQIMRTCCHVRRIYGKIANDGPTGKALCCTSSSLGVTHFRRHLLVHCCCQMARVRMTCYRNGTSSRYHITG